MRTQVNNLIITTTKPYKPATSDTIRRWVKTTLTNSGILNFSAHSVRSASTSKAKELGIEIQRIMTKACWKNEETFFKHYEKTIIIYKENNFNEIIT